MYRVRRPSTLFGAVVAVVLATATVVAAIHVLNGTSGMVDRPIMLNDRGSMRNEHGTSVSSVRWPRRGQAALAIGDGRPAASPHEQPVPIASVAKVMTAYLVLERYPLAATQDGFTITITPAQARAAAEDAADEQSVAPVQAGEQLTERQLLQALLIPSGNNIAQLLAARLAGSETRFVADMNTEARSLGMDRTTYTDPSGLDPSTVSTAADQLRVFRQAMRFPAFRQVVSMPSVTLPFAGTLPNTNPVLADGYAGKTGSDSAAGACLAFFTEVTVNGRRQTAVGVVLGQWETDSTSVSLAAAGAAAEQLVHSVAPASRVPAIAAPASRGRGAGPPDGRPRLPPRHTN